MGYVRHLQTTLRVAPNVFSISRGSIICSSLHRCGLYCKKIAASYTAILTKAVLKDCHFREGLSPPVRLGRMRALPKQIPLFVMKIDVCKLEIGNSRIKGARVAR